MKTPRISLLFATLFVGLVLASCGVNSNVMFKEVKGDDGKITSHVDSIPMMPEEDYRISPDDKISFTLTTNSGTKIIEKMTGITDERSTAGGVQYVVRRNGYAELPVIGKTHVAGMTVEQCEDTLIELYAHEYRDPFIQLNITNQRVIVFPGNGSDATVVPLTNTNTTLMEALARAGGITERGRSSRIKLMRRINGERQVYLIDLSTMKGLKHVDMIVQANDYIYVEPTAEIAKEIAEDVVPIVSLLSSAIFIISAVNLLK